jgi:hypothetical protein
MNVLFYKYLIIIIQVQTTKNLNILSKSQLKNMEKLGQSMDRITKGK